MNDNANIQQGTDEWDEARLGKITASNLTNVLMKPDAAGYKKYQATLVAERLTGAKTEGYSNFFMERGHEQEPEARAMYELENGVTVQEVGFIDHPTMPMTGASPDGLVGDDGGVEIKCVDPHVHLANIRGGNIDKKYRDQILWNMECGGRRWWDYCTYCPAFPMAMRLHVRRIEFDGALADAARRAVMKFEAEISATVNELQARYPGMKSG